LDIGSGEVVLQNNLTTPITVNVVSNTFETDGDIASGNNIVYKTGNGIWNLGGFTGSQNQLTLTVNQGEVDLNRIGFAIVHGLTVNSNALVKDLQSPEFTLGVYTNTLTSGGVLDLYGQIETLDTLNMTNGVLRNSEAGSAAILTVTNQIILNGSSNIFDVPTADATLEVPAGQPTIGPSEYITGTGSLVKIGLGTLDLESSNNYTGDTIVDGGTLILNYPDLVTNSTVTIATSAILNLNFSGTNVVAALVQGGVSKPAGIYSASTDSTYITGSGVLQVVPIINPLPGPIQFSVSGAALTLSWPTNLGWILQSQTDAPNVGLVNSNSAWFDVAGSSSITTTNVTINPTNAVFFRLRLP
jgi:autotransporter-associated beta strand protein